ncbi:MAG: hypothetical protein KBF63_22120, partial [Rhodoferax sp.]|nr:hypothetical protein [Rhodoferax sp.]
MHAQQTRIVRMRADLETAGSCQLQHGRVVAQHIAVQGFDTLAGRRRDRCFQQTTAQSQPLPRVGHSDRKFGRCHTRVVRTHKPRFGHLLLSGVVERLDNQCEMRPVVDVGQVARHRRGQHAQPH